MSGSIEIKDLNKSNEVAWNCPIIILHATNDGIFHYANIINHTQIQNDLPSANFGGTKFEVACCNFVQITKPEDVIRLTINGDTNVTIDNCCFSEIDCETLFSVVDRCSLIVKNCYYEKNATSGPVKIISPKQDDSTLSLTHWYIGKCFPYKLYSNIQNTCQEKEKFGCHAHSFTPSMLTYFTF